MNIKAISPWLQFNESNRTLKVLETKCTYTQWWKITKYIYLSTVLKYSFEVLVLYLSVSIFCYFILLLNQTSEANIVLFTPLHLFDNFSYFADSD